MKILELTLKCKNISAMREMYADKLGFEVLKSGSDYITFKVGESVMNFEHSDSSHLYHYCFLIPSNQLEESIRWMKDRVALIEIKPNEHTSFLESWNAESFYFYDGDGNIVEFIVRYDLQNSAKSPFVKEQILCINEIGLPSSNIHSLVTQLNEETGMNFWKGNLERFGTCGDQNGLILIPNYNIKKTWFPTQKELSVAPVKIKLEVNEQIFELNYENEQLVIDRI